MVEDIRCILDELGYTKITETFKEFRTRPLYRESQNDTSLVIYKDTGRWQDYALGIGGNMSEFAKLHSIDDIQAWLASKNIDINAFNRAQPLSRIKLPKVFPNELLLRLRKDHSYWIERGIPEETVAQLEGGVAGKGKMENRYVFPIFNSKKQIVGFWGRDLLKNENSKRPKWKGLGSKGAFVYPAFLNTPAIKESKSVILVESIGCLLALYNAGIKNVLVLFGINLGHGILNYLLKMDVRCIMIGVNNDAVDSSRESNVGNDAAQKLKSKLMQYFDENQVEIALPTKKDFGDMSREEILEWKKSRFCPLVS